MTLAPSPPWRRQPSPPPAPTGDAPSPLAVALDYIERGWSPIPIGFRSKAPSLPGWTDLRISADEASRYFNGAPANIGVVLGQNSSGLSDVDLDCPEAIAAAPYFLPKTAAIFGRETARASHWLYYTNSASVNLSANVYFDDPIAKERGAKARIVDLRLGPKVQTVFPGSAHEDTSEPIAWEPGCDGEPARVECDDLFRRVERLAACSLLARHWPAHGARHDARLAVAGVLVRAGFSESESKLFAEALARAVGDEDARDFAAAIRSTYARASSGEKFSGLPRACDVFGDAIGRAVADWLRLDESGADFGQSLLGPKPRATIVENGVVADAETGEILRQPAGESGRIGRLGILTSAQFVAGFTPPDYFLDGVCQRGFLYSLTAATGAGKTAVALTIAATAGGGGGTLGGREVMGGKVLFLAGENPDDARMRWIAMAHHFDFDIATIGVRFRPTAFDISKSLPDLRAEAEAAGEFSLIICDTSAAFFQGDDENSNTQLGAYARTQLRKLTELPGRPCVIVLCHPTKNASADNLLPRGGGAFLAEVDGNLTAANAGGVVTLHWQGKFRGPDFEPLRFALEKVSTPSLVDSRGREIPSVIARPLDMREAGALAADERREEDILLELMLDHEAASIAELARLAGWATGDGDTPHKSKVARILQSFAAERPPLAKKIRAHWTLTGNGQEEAARVRDERRKAEQNAARFSRLGEPE